MHFGWENGRTGRKDEEHDPWKGSVGAELDAKLWQITTEEQERGWLQGPFEVDAALEKFGVLMLPTRRFLVCQNGKFRPIDDYSVSGSNSTVGTG
eukprot:4293323-Amphidinium_carterae.1